LEFSVHEKTAKTIPIDIAASGANTVLTVPAGMRFLVHYMHLDASAAVNVTVLSGTTPLTGLLRFAAAGQRTFENGGDVVIKGRFGAQRNLVLSLSGAVDVDGFVTYTIDKSGIADPA
jgi:hypothetical protein